MSNEELSYLIAVDDAQLVAATGVVDDFNKQLAVGTADAAAAAGAATAKSGLALDTFGKKAKSLGKTFTHDLTLPIVAVGGVSADMAVHFQGAMEVIHTQAHASQAEVDNLSKAVLGMAASVGTGPDELAAGLYHIESAGLRGSQAMDTLKIAAEGARVGGANLEDVTNALDAAIVSHIKGVQNYSQAMGVLNATVGAGDMRMQDLADAMGTGILANAQSFGLSLKDVGGALATFGDNNIRGSKAAIYLRQVIATMGAPSHTAADALASIGVSSTQLANDMRQGGLVQAVTDLKTHLDASGQSATEQAQTLSHAFGGAKTSSAVLLLLDQLGRLKSKTDELGKAAGGFGADWEATTKTTSFQLDQLKAGLEATAVKLGDTLLPAIKPIASALGSVATAFGDLPHGAQVAIIGLAGFVAVLGPLLTVIGNVSVAIKGVGDAVEWAMDAELATNPIALAIAGIVALVAALVIAYKESGTFRDFVKTVFADVQTAATTFASFFTTTLPGAFTTVVTWVKTHWPEIAVLVAGPFAPLVALATNAFGVRSALETAFNAVSRFVSGVVSGIVKFFTQLPGQIEKTFVAAWDIYLALVQKPFTDLSDWLGFGKGGLLAGIVDFFTQLPGRIGDAILAGADELKNAVMKLFGGLPSIAKKLLGISSPSKVFAEIGENIVHGLIQGIENIGPSLVKSLETHVGGAVKTAGSAISSGLGDVGSFVGGLFGGGGSSSGSSGGLSGNQALGQMLAARMGWGSFAEWSALQTLWTNESGWNTFATNPSSGAYGIPQALPADKMASAGADWRTNPATQIAWGLDYIKSVYGDPINALRLWETRSPHWYGGGGIFSSPSVIGVGERGSEAVLPLQTSSGQRALSDALAAALDQLQVKPGRRSSTHDGPLVHVQEMHVRDERDAASFALALSNALAVR